MLAPPCTLEAFDSSVSCLHRDEQPRLPLLSETAHRLWAREKQVVNPTGFTGKVWMFYVMLFISSLTTLLAKHSCEFLRLAADHGIRQRISCAWLRMGSGSVHKAFHNRASYGIIPGSTSSRVLSSTVLKTTGLENILHSLFTGEFTCTCIDDKARKMLFCVFTESQNF